jgi:hypothetical protein
MSRQMTLRRAEAVALLGISDRTFTRLEAEAVLAPLTKGAGARPATYDGPALVAAFVAYRERQAAERAVPSDAAAARARKLAAEAQLKEHELAAIQGRMITVEDAKAAGFAVADAVREALLCLPGAAVQAGLLPAVREAALDALVRDALASLPQRVLASEEEA